MNNKIVYFITLILIVFSCKDEEKEANKYINSALVNIDNSNFSEALKDITKAIELTPKNSKLYYMRGNTYFNIQQYENAIFDYDRAIILNEKYIDAYYNRGSTYLLLDNNEKACSDFITAYKLGKKNIEEKVKKCK